MSTKGLVLALIGVTVAGCIAARHGVHATVRAVKGTGPSTKHSRAVPAFTEIEVSGAIRLEYKAGEPTAVEVEAQESIIPLVKTEVVNGKLSVSTDDSYESSEPIVVRVTSPELVAVGLSGACEGSVEGVHGESFKVDLSGNAKLVIRGNAGSLAADLSGASDLQMNGVEAKKASVHLSGISKITLGGKCDTVELEGSGSCQAVLGHLQVVDANVTVSGTSQADVNVSGKLDVQASGASSVRYVGNPTHVSKSTSGVSSVSAAKP